jgi:hypothetical protein
LDLAGVVAFVMLVILIGWLGIVLAATFHQVDREIRRRDRRG